MTEQTCTICYNTSNSQHLVCAQFNPQNPDRKCTQILCVNCCVQIFDAQIVPQCPECNNTIKGNKIMGLKIDGKSYYDNQFKKETQRKLLAQFLQQTEQVIDNVKFVNNNKLFYLIGFAIEKRALYFFNSEVVQQITEKKDTSELNPQSHNLDDYVVNFCQFVKKHLTNNMVLMLQNQFKTEMGQLILKVQTRSQAKQEITGGMITCIIRNLSQYSDSALENRYGTIQKKVKKEEKITSVSNYGDCSIVQCQKRLRKFGEDLKCENCHTVHCLTCRKQKQTLAQTQTLDNNQDQHICNPDDIKQQDYIDKKTKQCPKCGSRVQKLNGCNQVCCFANIGLKDKVCGTVFDFATLKVVTDERRMHNSDYVQYVLRRNQNQNGQRGQRNRINCDDFDETKLKDNVVLSKMLNIYNTLIAIINHCNQEFKGRYHCLDIISDLFCDEESIEAKKRWNILKLQTAIQQHKDQLEVKKDNVNDCQVLLKEISKCEKEVQRELQRNTTTLTEAQLKKLREYLFAVYRNQEFIEQREQIQNETQFIAKMYILEANELSKASRTEEFDVVQQDYCQFMESKFTQLQELFCQYKYSAKSLKIMNN